ncbi:hypothetical protein K2P56_03035 [Patescibacteria group bacterium]|nr:hypothetical protein [Patescibacteria group bacterium]
MIELLGFSFPILYIHLGTLGLVALLVLYADHQALSWVLGHKEKLNGKTIKTVHYLTLAGLAVMIISGASMAVPLSEYLFTVPAFFIKMGFVFALVINSFFIGKLMHTAVNHSYKSLAFSEKLPLFISGGVSGISWLGAVIAAFNLGL